MFESHLAVCKGQETRSVVDRPTANSSAGVEQMEPGSLPRRWGDLARGRPPNRLDPTSSAARFGVELRELRLAAGLRVKDLAGLLGFSPTRVSEVENGKGKLSHEFVDACERHLPADGALFTLFEVVVQEEAAERHAKLARRRGARDAGPRRSPL